MDNDKSLLIQNSMYERMAATLSCIGDGVVSTDIKGKITFMNNSAEEIIGCRAEEAQGKIFSELLPLINIDTNEVVENLVQRVVSTDHVIGLPNNTVMVTKDGIQRYISASCSPVKDTEGSTIGSAVVFRDITRIKLYELEIQNEKDNFKNIFNSAYAGMFILNKTAVITEVNDSALDFIGISREQLLGRGIGTAFGCKGNVENKCGCGHNVSCAACELKKAWRLALKEGKTTGSIEFNQVVIRSGNEKDIWLKASVTPLVMNGERNVLISLLDITERKQRELSAIRSRDAVFNLLDQFPILIWRTDSYRNTDYVNKSWIDFTGARFDKALDLGWIDSIHTDDREMCTLIFCESFNNKVPFEVEFRLRRNDGKYRWCLTIGTPYYDIDGNFSGYIGTVLDITDRKIAEEGLKRYQVLSESARDIILFVDLEGRIIEANDAAVKAYGYSRNELLSLTIFDLREKIDVTREQMQEADKRGIYFETVHIRKDGTSFPVEVNSQGTTIGSKRVLLSIIRDMTDRKIVENKIKENQRELTRAKDEAEAANRAKSEFLANMSHEIRTPINGMVGMIDLTLLTNLSYQQKDYLTTAKSCANTLLRIINDILDFSKMEAGKLIIENINFDIKELVEEIIKAHSPRAEDKGLDLNYTLSSAIPRFLVGDPTRLRQILNNLVNNAIKFTEHGEISVSVRGTAASDEYVELKFSVSDTGIGIASDEIDRLFKSFSQVDNSFTRRFGGTGLGLVISKQLVETMGGTMWVESKKDEGSSFNFTLRLKKGEYTDEKPVGVKKFQRSTKKSNILVVEDDRVNQMVIAHMLEGKGYKVEVANNGKEAVTFHELQSFDVILMDIQMPEMNGIEATKKIREIEGITIHTPIIALTAYALQGDREKFLSMGMDDYVSKPINMDELFEALDRAILKNKAQSELHYEVADNGELVIKDIRKAYKGQVSAPNIMEIQKKMDNLVLAINNGNLREVESSAHELKILFDNIDADKLKNSVFRIELAARRGNIEDILNLSLRIQNEFEEYKIERY